MSVGEFLTQHDLRLDDASYADEPPGKLRRLTVRGEGRTYIIALIPSPELFDEQRQWSKGVVLRAAIDKVEQIHGP